MDAIHWHSVFFLLFAMLACGFAVAVVVSANIVRMAFYLVISLGAVAGLFFLAGADFVGAMQLMIYVGGTMVLLVFGVMLTTEGPFVAMKIAPGQWGVAILAGSLLLGVLIYAAVHVDDRSRQPAAMAETGQNVTPSDDGEFRPTSTRLGLGLLGVRVDRLEQPNAQLRRGMSGYLLAFEIVSVHLLVILIGAAYLARAKKRVPQELEENTVAS